MRIISHLIIHFGLLALAFGGVIEGFRVLRIAVLDLKALEMEGSNGPRKLVVITRQQQSGYLLAVFAVCLALGGRIALASEPELDSPLVLTLIVTVDTIAMLLAVKEWMVRKTRMKLDHYYDIQASRERMMAHGHRRKTDQTVGDI